MVDNTSLWLALVDAVDKYDKEQGDSKSNAILDDIKRIKCDGAWTIIFWKDGKITRVKCSEDDMDTKSNTSGILAAMVKHYVFKDASSQMSKFLHKVVKDNSDSFDWRND